MESIVIVQRLEDQCHRSAKTYSQMNEHIYQTENIHNKQMVVWQVELTTQLGKV